LERPQPAHFHAKYAEHRTEINIRTLGLLRGLLPAKAMGLVTEWATLHQEELLDRWEQARMHQALERIEPLE
jgi:hypothetical protein